MRIVFVTNQLGLLRHFPTVLCELADRGHAVTIVSQGRIRGKRVTLGAAGTAFPVLAAPDGRSDDWGRYTRSLRTVRDYARFFGRDLRAAPGLQERAREWAYADAPRFVRALERSPVVQRGLFRIDQAARLVEEIIPSDAAYDAFLEQCAADAVLLTPMIDFGSGQPDIVKSADRLGIPAAFLPFSWDNLSSKGLVRVVPDRVLVWNEIQGEEAVRWHGVPRDRIVITGAPRFDKFFALKPSSERAEYLRAMGFAGDEPMILFLGSSPLIAPDELPQVTRWLRALRDGPEPVANANVLLRPHPKNLAQWTAAAFEDERTRIHRVDSLKHVDQPLFDALSHSHAVVGVNTSALLEAAIVGRPVLAPPPADGQPGAPTRTLHERYLTDEGGLLVTSSSVDEHVRQLERALADGARRSERSAAFVASFIRPRGADLEVTPIMADEIERLGELSKRPSRPPVWQRPIGALVRASLRAGLDPGGT